MATPDYTFSQNHLLGIDGLNRLDIEILLNLAESFFYSSSHQQPSKSLIDKTVINLFFENSTRTMSSFEIAAKRLGAHVVNMNVGYSSIKKGETFIDTAMTLNAMRPDVIVIRHSASGGVKLLSRKVDCAVVNAGDGQHEHPTQGLLDVATIKKNKRRIEGLRVAICGDIIHSRVARSTTLALALLGAEVRLCGPRTLLPKNPEPWGAQSIHSKIDDALADADVVMVLRLQHERMNGAFIPSHREYFHYYGITNERLKLAAPEAIVMHPGPMNRGVEIDSSVADGPQSVITEQVELGVAVREAVLHTLVGRQ